MGRAGERPLKGLGMRLVGAFSNGYAHVAPMNFRRVDGNIMRTMQLSKAQLGVLYEREDFQSIVNLRGCHPGRRWYDNEADFAEENGVKLHSIGISSRNAPSRELLLDLIYVLDSCEKPALVHCGGGADRAGFASAIYRLLGKDSVGDAGSELCIRYGHFPKSALDKVIDSYGVVEGEIGFRDWVDKEYSPENFK